MTMRSVAVICLSCQAAALSIAPTPLPRCAIATRRAAVSMASATSTDDATAAFAAEAKRAAEAELDTPTIAELVEASFVRAVMDLRTGLVDTLKLFVAAVKAGYERAVPVTEMLAARTVSSTSSASGNLESSRRLKSSARKEEMVPARVKPTVTTAL